VAGPHSLSVIVLTVDLCHRCHLVQQVSSNDPWPLYIIVLAIDLLAYYPRRRRFASISRTVRYAMNERTHCFQPALGGYYSIHSTIDRISSDDGSQESGRHRGTLYDEPTLHAPRAPRWCAGRAAIVVVVCPSTGVDTLHPRVPSQLSMRRPTLAEPRTLGVLACSWRWIVSTWRAVDYLS
jgi:hypothetical protein